MVCINPRIISLILPLLLMIKLRLLPNFIESLKFSSRSKKYSFFPHIWLLQPESRNHVSYLLATFVFVYTINNISCASAKLAFFCEHSYWKCPNLWQQKHYTIDSSKCCMSLPLQWPHRPLPRPLPPYSYPWEVFKACSSSVWELRHYSCTSKLLSCSSMFSVLVSLDSSMEQTS